MVSRGNGGRIRYQSLPKKSIKGGGGDYRSLTIN